MGRHVTMVAKFLDHNNRALKQRCRHRQRELQKSNRFFFGGRGGGGGVGRELVPEHTAKDLGVILDTNLTYDKDINNNNINNNFINLLKKAFQLNLQCQISKT